VQCTRCQKLTGANAPAAPVLPPPLDERGVKLATDFIASLTKNPNEFQDLLQLVEHNRNKIPDDKKKTVKNTYLDFPM
jgi:hypothetical protein